MSAVASFVALLALPFFYVIPGDRVLSALEQARHNVTPLHIEASLAKGSLTGPDSVSIDLHPDYGVRIKDNRGGRWWIQGGRVVAGSLSPAPAWLPELEILSLATADSLRAWLVGAGIEVAINELGRIESFDCFVLGGRDGSGQLWIDKERLEVLLWVSTYGRQIHYSGWSDWEGGQRFPSRLELHSRRGAFATLAIESVRPAQNLAENDFSWAWVQAAAPPRSP